MRAPSSPNILAAMSEWAKRLRDRQAQRKLSKAALVRHVRIDPKTLNRFLNGVLNHGLQPEQFLRLCEILNVTPNQAFGLEPLDGDGPVPPDARAPEIGRLLDRVAEMTPENLALAADLIDRLAHHRAGLGRPVVAEEAEA